MGNSAFYYSPHPDTSKVATQTIDLGETISDLQIHAVPQSATTR